MEPGKRNWVIKMLKNGMDFKTAEGLYQVKPPVLQLLQ